MVGDFSSHRPYTVGGMRSLLSREGLRQRELEAGGNVMIRLDYPTPTQMPTRNQVMPWQKPQCAWCLTEQGLELGNGSHGICKQHAACLLQQWKEARSQQYQGAIA